MSRSPSSSAQAAREALGLRLREIRNDAGLRGRDVAASAGWHASKCSRLETGTTPPSPEDIRIWCRVCGVPELAEDLITQARSVNSMYRLWRRREGTGLRALQHTYTPVYERARSFRIYTSDMIPGFLQTHAYAKAVLSTIARFRGVPDDSEAAAKARLQRSRIVREGGRRFAFVLEESVLYHHLGDSEAMAGQLGYLLTAMTFPDVSIGIIPLGTPRSSVWSQKTFGILDGVHVYVELLSAEVIITTPSEMADYDKAFRELSALAVYGRPARSRITAAVEALDV